MDYAYYHHTHDELSFSHDMCFLCVSYEKGRQHILPSFGGQAIFLTRAHVYVYAAFSFDNKTGFEESITTLQTLRYVLF
jgi:hypothetical protein